FKSKEMAGPQKKFFHIVRAKYCKGCSICVALCPKKVLELKNEKVFAARPDDCIGCRMCELRCPDFAIEVHPVEEKSKFEADVNLVGLGLNSEANHG
ncbi:MAG TPA: 4Fe-4S dicluster domain-containing protein, partial [Rectinema sp.]|nr:4Fe-4S dicluster domain-containing protein [Rectinema sp.]